MLVAALVHGVDMPGYVTLIAAITGLGGLQMVMLGVIGEYIGRIYYETKKRPHYLLKQTNMDPADRLNMPPAPGGGTTRGR
ncbi:MAG TPA: hypothetical protein VFH76_16875 [Kribbella sp.]|nr:hypothetical protein [Kribbella sp.]